MSTLTETLRLPDYLADASQGAWVEYTKRTVTFQLLLPGRIYRNDFDTAYFAVREQTPWRGEPLSLITAQRTQKRNGGSRESFTGAACDRIREDLVPTIARYGFDRLWQELYRDRMLANADKREQDAAERQRIADWWRQLGYLHDVIAIGVAQLRPRPPVDPTKHAQRVPVLQRDMRPTYETVACDIYVEGELVGYFTTGGTAVPLPSVLEAPHGPPT